MRGKGGHHEVEAAAFRYLAGICADVASDRRPSTTPLPAGPGPLFALAARHRVAVPVLARLAKAVRPLDASLADRLDRRVAKKRFAGLGKAQRLATISAALSAAGVRHLAIKGPALAQQLYGDVAARDCKDLDLLVDPAAFAAATGILSGLGYRAAPEPNGDGSAKDRPFVGCGIELEVHSRLIEVDALLPLPFEQIWRRRAAVTIGGTPVPTLSPVDTLLYLCAHGATHLWFRLKWLEDIARIVVVSDGAILDEALDRARRAGASAIVVGALRLVEEVFGIAPAGMPPLPTTRTDRALVRLSREALAAPAELASSPSLGWILRKLPVQFGMGSGWRYYRDLAGMLLLSPHDFDATGLPRGLGWMRLPLRPVMLIRHRWTQATARR